MERDTIINTIAAHRADLERFGVRSLSLFGSLARGEETDTSDVDLLVEFSRPPGFRDYFGLNLFLEQILRRHVDLVQPETLRPRAARKAMAEAIRVA